MPHVRTTPAVRSEPAVALAVALAASLGCQGGAPSTPVEAATPAPSVAPEAPAPTGPGPSAAGLPDLHVGVATGLCEQIRGTNIPGADSYFFGELLVNGTAVTGAERWELTANSAWKARGGDSCSIEWRLVGSRTHTSACGECDYGLVLNSTPLVDKSDCIEDLKKREGRPGKIAYDVKLQSDGTALVYFAGSGKLVGEGYHKDGALVFRSAHQCKWF